MGAHGRPAYCGVRYPVSNPLRWDGGYLIEATLKGVHPVFLIHYGGMGTLDAVVLLFVLLLFPSPSGCLWANLIYSSFSTYMRF